jgi:hypothetical protein
MREAWFHLEPLLGPALLCGLMLGSVFGRGRVAPWLFVLALVFVGWGILTEARFAWILGVGFAWIAILWTFFGARRARTTH